jgi:hypothetical protein
MGEVKDDQNGSRILCDGTKKQQLRQTDSLESTQL